MKVTFLVDGFNLYHSLCDAIDDGAPSEIKWLDICSLCKSFLSIFNDTSATAHEFYYFSSFTTYKGPGPVQRHGVYKRALEATGVKSVFGEFKDKRVRCEASCKQEYIAHVEKQTDVNIALKLLEVFYTNSCDACLIISGDGDLLKAVETANRLFPKKPVAIAFPYKRWHPELSKHAQFRVKIDIARYKAHILDNPLELPDGKVTRMPIQWASS